MTEDALWTGGVLRDAARLRLNRLPPPIFLDGVFGDQNFPPPKPQSFMAEKSLLAQSVNGCRRKPQLPRRLFDSQGA